MHFVSALRRIAHYLAVCPTNLQRCVSCANFAGMKRNILILLLLLSGHCLGYAQQLISGTVTDGRHPIVGANVFVKGTTDGCLTDSLGHFSFSTLKADSTQLMVTCIGYDNAERNWQKGLGPPAIRLYERTTTIDEVVVTGSTFRFGQANGVKQPGALDVVLDGKTNTVNLWKRISIQGGY